MATTFNIQRYCLHDGPGIRTTVFFKGCPLNCHWCHNPESQSFHKELLHYKAKCICCGSCIDTCTLGGIKNNDTCTSCGNCCEACPTNARVIAGTEQSLAELIGEIEKDRIFYDQSGGGVTLSGGEPLSQFEDLLALTAELKQKRIHVAVDTSGYTSWDKLSALLPNVDLFLYDVKLMNEEKHQQYTGVSNKDILENLIQLSKTCASVIVRIPIIPTINDSAQELDAIIQFLKTNDIHYSINLLPYHNISKEKYNRLARTYMLEDIAEPTSDHMKKIKDLFLKNGFQTTIGG